MIRLALLSSMLIASNSVAGEHLMTKARNLNNDDYQLSFLAQLSIKFNSCHTVHSFDATVEDDNEQTGTSFRAQHLIDFGLCPNSSNSNGCSKCSGGGEYVSDLRDFIGAYVQMQEAQCETVENSCNCNYYNGDDQSCLSECYRKAGLDFCGQDNEFDVTKYVDCTEADFGNYYGSFYIGPVCSSNGKAINLQLFTDASCTTAAPEGTYERYHYGYPLPFSQKSIVDEKCISCANDDGNDSNNNNNNNKYNNYNTNNYGYYKKAYYQNQEPSEMCEELYNRSGKCEKHLELRNSYNQDNGACDYIHKIIPALENVYRRNGAIGGMAAIMAAIFALSTIGACFAAFYFYREVDRLRDVHSEVEMGNKYDKMVA
uniref:Uncharacterized protein n=1 Tax=Chaetoceros debilis TaxID=122233 RepID=A0A7S3V4C9_9STRA